MVYEKEFLCRFWHSKSHLHHRAEFEILNIESCSTFGLCEFVNHVFLLQFNVFGGMMADIGSFATVTLIPVVAPSQITRIRRLRRRVSTMRIISDICSLFVNTLKRQFYSLDR
jgi:hypothetical protein